MITGPPGVGKTTLAKMLIYRCLSDLDCELLVAENQIEDVERVISIDEEKKQLIFFDDFLGSNIYEILNPKNSENSLANFIKRIKLLKNKFLILTTRTTILNEAVTSYEKFRHSKTHELFQFEVRLKDYSQYEKARILYNHMYFGKVPEEYTEQIISNRNYLKIVNHNNYNPRLIEFFTDNRFIEKITPSKYIDYIFNLLNNPQEIWLGSYTQQLNDEDRFLLCTLLTLKGKASLTILETAFEERLRFEVNNYGLRIKEDSFNKSLRKLSNGYLNLTINNSRYSRIENEPVISFSNPSIGDFLFNYLRESSFERKRILYSIKFIEQLLNTFHLNNPSYLNLFENDLQDYYYFFTENEKRIKFFTQKGSIDLELINVYLVYFKNITSEDILERLFLKGDFKSFDSYQVDKAVFILKEFHKKPKFNSFVVEDWNDLIICLYENSDDEWQFSEIRNLFDLYKQSYNDFLKNEENYQLVGEVFTGFFSEYVKEAILENYREFDYELETTYFGFSDRYGYEDVEYFYSLNTDLDSLAYEYLTDFDFIKDDDEIELELEVDYDKLKKEIEEKYNESMDSQYESDEFGFYRKTPNSSRLVFL